MGHVDHNVLSACQCVCPFIESSCDLRRSVLHSDRQSQAAPQATGFLAKSVRLMEPQRSLAVLRLPAPAASKPWGRTLCALHAAEGEDGVRAVAVTAAGNLFEYSVQVGLSKLVHATADSRSKGGLSGCVPWEVLMELRRGWIPGCRRSGTSCRFEHLLPPQSQDVHCTRANWGIHASLHVDDLPWAK